MDDREITRRAVCRRAWHPSVRATATRAAIADPIRPFPISAALGFRGFPGSVVGFLHR